MANSEVAIFFAWIMLFVFILSLVALYCLPTIIALKRKKEDYLAIIMVNLFAGWTFVGWVIAIVWAFTVDKK